MPQEQLKHTLTIQTGTYDKQKDVARDRDRNTKNTTKNQEEKKKKNASNESLH